MVFTGFPVFLPEFATFLAAIALTTVFILPALERYGYRERMLIAAIVCAAIALLCLLQIR